MTTAPAKLTVFEAWSKVMEDVQSIGKNQTNATPGQNYKFRGVDAVMNAVGPVLRKYGVFVVPEHVEQTHRDVLTTKGNPSRESTITVTYRVYGPTGDSFPMEAPGEAMDSGDKGTAKAMSVAYRTVLLQALTIPTNDPDPDEQTYERAPEPARYQRPADDHASQLTAVKRRLMAAVKRAKAGEVNDDDDAKSWIVAEMSTRGLDKESVVDVMKLAEELEGAK
jgi:hypothetical protein